jgi:two-component system OmpR family sensor kinase
MTLRTRLVLALVLLATAGLAVFGVSTYGLYSRAQYDRLDDQLRSARPLATRVLLEAAKLTQGGGAGDPGSSFPQPPADDRVVMPLGAWLALTENDGTRVVALAPQIGQGTPDIPAGVMPSLGGTLVTTGSATGSGEWRVLIARSGPDDHVVIVAIPTSDVTAALQRLILIESLAGVALLGLLGIGSWLVVRHGLRPLEKMADSAGSITAGSITSGALAQRVSPADGRSEVGQLGLALNTMLTELEQAFAERDATEQKLRRFLADASHELRTPLTSIQGFAELFRLGATSSPEELALVLRRIEEESARMKVLVDDLLMLARLDQSRPVVREAVDLTILAADACSDARVVAADRRFTLDAPEPVVVQADPGHLRQAVTNLVTNAVKHTPPGTPVEVRVSVADDIARLEVRDHGQGLDDDALTHVFDRFWQADAARVGTGAGLGLSIVDGIVREHHGTVSASNADGGGASFVITLPIPGAVT